MSEVDEFYAEHEAGGPTHVVMAIGVCKGSDGFRNGIFSTIAKARAWANTLSDDEYEHVVFAPYIVDVPEYGNVLKRHRQ